MVAVVNTAEPQNRPGSSRWCNHCDLYPPSERYVPWHPQKGIDLIALREAAVHNPRFRAEFVLTVDAAKFDSTITCN